MDELERRKSPTGPSRTAVRVSIALATAAVVALAVVAVANRGSSAPRRAAQPVTIETALAAFGGSTDLYLKLNGINGTVGSARHLNEILIDTVRWGVTNGKSTPTGSVFSDITVTKGIDIASPAIFAAVAAGTPIGTAKVSADKPGGAPFTFASLSLKGVTITSQTESADRTDGFDEKITLRFTKATVSYTVQKSDGSAGPPITACWNLLTHVAC